VAALISPWLDRFTTNQVLLHVGIGVGWLEESVPNSLKHLDCIAVDFSTTMARSTKKRLPWLEVIIADGEALPFRRESLDGLILNRAVKFVSVPQIFSQAGYALKKNGTIAVIFDCRDTLFQRFLERMHRPYDTTLKSSYLIRMLRQHNFHFVSCDSATAFPLHRFWRLPIFVYPVLGFIDNTLKSGRISVMFGLKVPKE
jgi:ubiquinone/menaquinone biosynthesis C-methylase UbiE